MVGPLVVRSKVVVPGPNIPALSTVTPLSCTTPRSSIFRLVIDNEALVKPAGKTKVCATVYTLGLPAMAFVLALRLTVTALAGADDRASDRNPNPTASLRKSGA